MKKQITKLILGASIIAATVSCSSTAVSLSDPNESIQFTANDFEILGPVEASAQTSSLLGILTLGANGTSGDLNYGESSAAAGIPIIGSLLSGGALSVAQSQAKYAAIAKYPEADVILYPQFTTDSKNLLIVQKYDVKVQGIAAKLKR